MSDPFVAEIRTTAFNFAPRGWAMCNGQLMPISQNTALFSLLGTMYGGDGKSTFALPNLNGAVAVGQGQGQGLSDYFIGQEAGSEYVTLLTSEIPAHTHQLYGSVEDGTQGTLTAGVALAHSVGGAIYHAAAGAQTVTMNPQSLAPAGGSLPHNNMMPTLVLNFIIALQGIFPPRG